MAVTDIHAAIEHYYAGALARHGTTPQGVDWNSASSQQLRFHQLLRVLDGATDASILDFGCGYGALVDLLIARGVPFSYTGYDLSPDMIGAAAARYANRSECTFVSGSADPEPADFVVASGIFNVRLGAGPAEWEGYVEATLDRLAGLARKGFAFNMLTSHCTPGRREARLHYADPAAMFEYCRTHFSRRVALLHDTPLFEFTMLVHHDS